MQNTLVKSAVRVFELLELFEAEQRPLRVAEIVQKLGAPQSSVSMLLKTLASQGYMEYERATRSYCPSVRVAFLCEWATRMPGQRETIHDTLRRLASETGESVLLGRKSGLSLQYISVIQSQHALRFSPSPGVKRPMHHAAIGIMLLSEMKDEQIELLLRRYNAERGKGGPIARIAQTLRAVEQAREQGWYESANLATSGAGVIATLIPTKIRSQRLAIGIGAPVDRLHQRRKQLLPALLAAAGNC
ncbi:IclR family transcriptional regulator [Variovorax paradoxus]|jgi:IclR family acetate operon transcriptional repressor|uniref:IclR family transcriptional regulator n=1 Tax=Variovorax TaxID=34072 RepID=UPI0006E6B3D1|nr:MULTISPECIES: helix-turn-helix domain-containing protein [unclassified Variovorax]KPU90321.1 IclR family transcriptional regulator [Variovorax paradoxus]KPV03502.1 IclR family transcriptional regulator [Variovorax paradoxus]KPV04905.1 IclR family transcriptional regulator [Variovorax paradoxus]KPV19351.1 IclR family transcriptional regulator [Variovorax paradoxus]KPV29691.1 IclR family transcriptional regulator [Variovorax paradoxus]